MSGIQKRRSLGRVLCDLSTVAFLIERKRPRMDPLTPPRGHCTILLKTVKIVKTIKAAKAAQQTTLP